MNQGHRYLSLDILKGLGITYLIFLHQIVWMFIESDSGHLIYPEAYPFVYHFCHSILGMLGLQIPLLAGTTFFFHIKINNPSWQYVWQRALALIGLGFLMNVLAFGLSKEFYFEDVFDWDVLAFIGLAMMASYPALKKLKDQCALIVIMGLGLITLSFAHRFPLSEWKGSYLYIVFIGDVYGENYWPFCPWFIIFVWGLILGKIFLTNKQGTLIFVMMGGIISLFVSMLTGHFLPPTNIDNIWGPSLFKPSPLFILGIIGFSSVVIPLFYFFIDCRNAFKMVLQSSMLAYWGQGILWIYFLTTILGYNMTYFIQKRLDLTYQESMLALPCLIFVQLCMAYGIGWMMKRQKRVCYY